MAARRAPAAALAVALLIAAAAPAPARAEEDGQVSMGVLGAFSAG
jgi:hypothetical protein